MELHSSRACIVIVVFLAALEISCVQLVSYEDKFCEGEANCTLGVTGCQLLLVNCSSEDGYYEKHEQLSWLRVNSSCDLIPEQFHSPEIIHVLHVENYTNNYNENHGTLMTISVWSSPNNGLSSPLKLLRSFMVNQTNSGAGLLTSALLLVDSLSCLNLQELGGALQNLHEALESINETLPTDLEQALRLASPGDRHLEVRCNVHISEGCRCHLCITTTTFKPDAADNVSSKKMKIPDGHYVTNIGIHAESIVVSSTLSFFHMPDINSVDDWQLGTAGGWAPSSNDTNMTMTFQSLTTTVCGIVIQGMASSTYRSLDLFSISAADNNAVNYSSGMLLDSKSFHYFGEPAVASKSITLRVLQPEDPTRVGFRAGLIACDDQPHHPYDSSLCEFAAEVKERFENLTQITEVGNTDDTEEDPTAATVAVYKAIKELVNTMTVPKQEFKVTQQTNKTEISVEGVESQKLLSAGFTFSALSLPGGKQNQPTGKGGGEEVAPPPLSIAIPLEAFKGLSDASSGSPPTIVLIVVAVSSVSEEAPSVQLNSSSTESSIASPIITLNIFSNRSIFQLSQMDYTVVARKEENGTRDTEPVCAFFKESSGSVKWETKGCHVDWYDNKTSAVSCSCNHTTSYAVMFQVTKSESSPLASIVTIAGLSISITALAMALVVYFLVRDQIMAARYIIHSNLMGALLISAVLFVSGVLKTDDELQCTILKFVYQYLFTAAFCWMLAEGIHLYQRIIAVFESGKNKNWIYFLIGWGLPLVFVAVTVGCTMPNPLLPNPLVELSAEGELCLFGSEDNSVWFVLSPVMFIIVINLVILVCITAVVFRAVGFQAEKGASDKLKQAKAALRSALLLTPLLGSTYIFGPLTSYLSAMEIVFNVINSLQGFFIALFYCALNTEIRTAITERIRRSKEASSLEGSTSGAKVKKTKSFSTGLFNKNKVTPVTQFTADE